MKTKGLGVIMFLLAIALLLWSWGSPESLIHIPTLIYLVLATGGLTLAKCRRGGGKRSVLNNVKRYAVLCGLIGSLVDFIQVRHFVHTLEPVLASISVALMPILYGLVVYCVADAFLSCERSEDLAEKG